MPIPPSKTKGHPEYDDRIMRICRAIDPGLDIRELILQRETMVADHESDHRHSVDDLVANYELQEALCEPAPQKIAIIDDVLTVGTHFKAMQHILRERFSEAKIVGFFVARRVLRDPAAEFGEALV